MINKEIKQKVITMLQEGYKGCEIAKEFGVSETYVCKVKKELKHEEYEGEGFDMIYEDEGEKEGFKEGKLLEEIIELKRSEEQLLKKNQKLQDSKNLNARQLRAIMRKDNYYELFQDFLKDNIHPLDNPEAEYKNRLQEKIDMVLLSDIHSDELITKKSTVYNEEVTFDIIQKRIRKYEKTLIERQIINKNKYLNVFIIGDIISGSIHEELYENKEAGSFDLMYKISCVIAKFVMNLSKYWVKVYVHTSPGNHGRLSNSIKYSRTDENFDNMIYILVRSMLTSNNRIKVNIRTEPFYIIKINDKYFAIGHGDGKTIELMRQSGAYLIMYGHVHRAGISYSGNCIEAVNGAFNKGNGWVVKQLGKITEHQFQLSYQLDVDNNGIITLGASYLNCVTELYENLETYGEILTEEQIFGGNDFYQGNIFEQTIGNYR